MEENLYNLNIEYLIVAQQLILSGGDQKAMFCLGLSSEAVSNLKIMSIRQLKQLARSKYMLFTPRFNQCNWEEFLRNEQLETILPEEIALDLLMFLPCTQD